VSVKFEKPKKPKDFGKNQGLQEKPISQGPIKKTKIFGENPRSGNTGPNPLSGMLDQMKEQSRGDGGCRLGRAE